MKPSWVHRTVLLYSSVAEALAFICQHQYQLSNQPIIGRTISAATTTRSSLAQIPIYDTSDKDPSTSSNQMPEDCDMNFKI